MRLLIILLFIFNYSYSQIDGVPINQLDKKGKKHGYWKTFVDSNLTNVSDSTKATWYYYRLFYHGKFVTGFKNGPVDKKYLDEFEFVRPKSFTKPTPIDGTFKATWNLKDPNQYILIFENGYMKELHNIFSADGSNWDISKYDKKFDDNPYSFFYRKFHVWDKEKLRETFYYYENGRMKKKKSSREVKSSNYFENNKF